MRWILGILLVLALAVGALVFYLDSIIATAIEAGGTTALGVETQVEGVSIRPVAGRFGIDGLGVSNPPGFDRPHFLALRSGRVHARVIRLLREDPVVIDRIELEGIAVSLERKGGKTNYDTILANLGTSESEPVPADDAAGPGVVIRELVIRDVDAHIALSPVGGKLTELDVNVPEIRLSNLGSQQDPVELRELFGTVTKAVLDAVARRSDLLPADLARDLRGRLGRLEDVPIELPGSVGEAQQKLKESTPEKLREGLKGLLRRED
jgi:hypothetical protein